jgi:hypothetical protein
LVERRSPKPNVGGSSPPGRVIYLHKTKAQTSLEKFGIFT